MPTLSGSEWALLCVVVRQTLGWHDPATGGRKTSDWLSHRQLKARTGRGSDAVCHAVDSLVRRDLIEVCDEVAHPLATPAERRRANRLFYALSPRLLARLRPAGHPEPEPSEKPDATASPSVPAAPQPLPTVRPSRFRKPESTKETGTKYRISSFGKAEWKPTANGFSTARAAWPNEDGCGCPWSLEPPPPPGTASTSSPAAPPDPELVLFLRFYRELLRQHRGIGGGPGAPGPTEQARLRAALDRHGPERLQRLAQAFFESCSALLHYDGYGLGAFLGVLPTLAVLRPRPGRQPPRQVLSTKPAVAEELAPREE
jgi:hypothetical protein